VLVVLDSDDVLNWVSLRNVPRVHLLDAGQLNTYDVLVADEVIFTEAALAEFVAGRSGAGSEGGKPDLATRLTPGGVPSIAPAEGEGTVEAVTGAEPAPAKKAPAKKAAAKKAPAASAEEAAPADAAEAASAPVEQAAAANAGPDAQAPTEDGTTDASTEEKA
jgi:large subunit ribosomal protein L4